MARVIGAKKQELDSEYSLGSDDGKKGLILESWGPKDRNRDYNRALTVILERLKAAGVPYINAWVVSRPMLKYPQAQRVVKVDGSERISLLVRVAADVRLEMGRAQAQLKKAEESKGGNRSKRILLYHSLLTDQMWSSIATGTFEPGFFEELLHTPTSDSNELEAKVSALILGKSVTQPAGNARPQRSTKEIGEYERDPEVKAWVLSQAGGVCEVCDALAPFTRSDGFPYLEVHHLLPLAEGGSDTTANAVAACPNCHRALHYSHQKDLLRSSVLGKVVRLKDEAMPPHQ